SFSLSRSPSLAVSLSPSLSISLSLSFPLSGAGECGGADGVPLLRVRPGLVLLLPRAHHPDAGAALHQALRGGRLHLAQPQEEDLRGNRSSRQAPGHLHVALSRQLRYGNTHPHTHPCHQGGPHGPFHQHGQRHTHTFLNTHTHTYTHTSCLARAGHLIFNCIK